MQLYCLDPKFTNSELLEMLPFSNSYYLATFIGGRWWRLSRSQKQRRLVAWRRQKIAFTSSGRILVEDEINTSALKREQIETIGIWCRVKAGGRISKEPFFGVKRSINFTLDGKPLSQQLSQGDIERLKIKIATASLSATPLSPPSDNIATMRRTPMLRSLDMVAESIAREPTNQTEASQTQDTQNEGREENREKNLDDTQDEETTQTATENPQQTQLEPTIEVTQEGSQNHPGQLVDGFQLIQSVASQIHNIRKQSPEISLSSFQKPKGMVPRIIYGQKGRKFIETLASKCDRKGNEILLAWLNTPGMFQTPYKERKAKVQDTEERLRKLSLRKFTYGNVGQSFSILQRTPQTKTKPTEDDIRGLFPEETSKEEIPCPAKERSSISISAEELMSVVRRLPRDRACGESQLSYDHIKYATSRDETVANMLQGAINFLLNNPEKVDKQLYIGTGYFLQKEGGKLRPIVLQETITKVAHRCLNRRLLNLITDKIPKHQFCIGCPNGTTRAALELQSEMKGEDAKYVVAVDFTNAFNSISRKTVIQNMIEMGISPNIISYIKTYLDRFAVKHGEKLIKNGRGVPQGCPLSMTLFSIGTSHLIKIIEAMGVRVYAYADDMALVADTKEQIEAGMKTLESKAAECGLLLNRDKTRYFTLKEEDEDNYISLSRIQWTYLGIPMSTNQDLVREALSKTVDKVAEKSRRAWEAPLLQQAYFIERLCIGPMLTHIVRGTDLQGDTDTFLTDQQMKLEQHWNPLLTKIPRVWRIQPVSSGGLGLTDIRMTQKAAREAMLIEAGKKRADDCITSVTEGKEYEDERYRWQKMFTSILQQLAIKEHQTRMRIGEEKETFEPTVHDSHDSFWLSTPPMNPAQILSDTAFKIAIQLRYNIDDIQEMKWKCPFCGKPLTFQHSLACGKANSGTAISRHNTITKIIGTHIAAQGMVAEYERKLPVYSENKPHIPDVTYIKIQFNIT